MTTHFKNKNGASQALLDDCPWHNLVRKVFAPDIIWWGNKLEGTKEACSWTDGRGASGVVPVLPDSYLGTWCSLPLPCVDPVRFLTTMSTQLWMAVPLPTASQKAAATLQGCATPSHLCARVSCSVMPWVGPGHGGSSSSQPWPSFNRPCLISLTTDTIPITMPPYACLYTGEL